MRKKSRLVFIAVLTAVILFMGLYLYIENSSIDVETIPVTIQGLPVEFDGMRILQLSDLHLPVCALPPDQLAALVEKNKPDLIFLTGDIIDRYCRFDSKDLYILAQKLSAIAPCYAVKGNNEQLSGKQQEWVELLQENGVIVLDDAWISIWRNGKAVALGGLTEGKPVDIPPDEAVLPVKLVLSHYPQYINDYADAGYSLVFSGHAHGGQIRLFGQGLFAPGQGMFPKYTSGLYRQKNTQMIVSRGLKNVYFPVRIGNAPHIPIAQLKAERP